MSGWGPVPTPRIDIVPYDPNWPTQAAAAIEELRPVLDGVIAEIEHIGSTAVPGLAAKPTIDLMAAVKDLEAVKPFEERLEALEYRPHFNGMTDRLLYIRASDGRRTHILHVVTLDSWSTRNQRILRDFLREHPEDVARYAELKRRIVANGIGPGDYARAKTELIQELTDRARAELGLPSIPVWEMGPRPDPEPEFENE